MKAWTTRRVNKGATEPMRHAVDRIAGRRHWGWVSICGVDVARSTGDDFDPDHPRACKACRRELRGAA